MNFSKIATGVAVVAAVAIGCAFVFKDRLMIGISSYMHSSMHDMSIAEQ